MRTTRSLTASQSIRGRGGAYMLRGSVHAGGSAHPHSGQNSWHTLVKNIIFPQLLLRAVMIWSCFPLYFT